MQNPLLLTAGFTFVLHREPDSVCICLSADGGSHVSGMTVTNHLKRFSVSASRRTTTRPCTQVGTLAVAPHMFPCELILADALASRLERLCSHPLDYPGGRYPLPFELNHACPDFPPSLATERLPSAEDHYPIHFSECNRRCIFEIRAHTIP